MEEKEVHVIEQPAHKLAIPLFLITSIPYFIAMMYHQLVCCEPDRTFGWFGAFYLGLSGLYLLRKLWKS